MHRRNMLTAAIKIVGAAIPISLLGRRAEADAPNAAKVVYHLSDADKVDFVLGNIRNHYDGMGGPQNVTIALVVHGPALQAFHMATAKANVKQRTAELKTIGLHLNACANTMRGQNITLTDLLPGFMAAEKGGVVMLAELQSQGYAYLRP